MSDLIKIGQVIAYKGEQWKVIGVGVTNPDNGNVYLHLAHTTKGVTQRNGFRPLQACDWVDLKEAVAKV
jgi:hypothetical protein